MSGGMVIAESLWRKRYCWAPPGWRLFNIVESYKISAITYKQEGRDMLVDGELIKDGMGMISYLDRKLQEVAASNKMATGIIIGSHARKALTEACQKVMGQAIKAMETINRFRNVLLIEDGDHPDRLEVVCGVGVVVPVEGNAFLDLKKVGPRLQR